MSGCSGESIAVLIADSDLIRRELLARELQRRSRFKIRSCNDDVLQCKHILATFPASVLLWAESSQSDSKRVVSAMREVLISRPSLRGVALLESWERDSAVNAFRSGVRGLFSLGQGSIDELRKCILCVDRNQVWASNEQVLFLIEAFKRSPLVRIANANGSSLLTPRQQEMVELVAEGMGNREVAQRLNITENTVKKSLLRIFDKVGVSNRVELVLSALAFKNQEPVSDPPAPGRSPAIAVPALSENREDELA